jgi:hypothetical protein
VDQKLELWAVHLAEALRVRSGLTNQNVLIPTLDSVRVEIITRITSIIKTTIKFSTAVRSAIRLCNAASSLAIAF